MTYLPRLRPVFALQHGNGAPLCTQTANVAAEQQISLQRGVFPPALLRYLVFSVSYPAVPSLAPRSGTSERSRSPYRRRVLVDVRAVGQVDEDGVHVLHVCDGDCQVGQSGQWLVFILILKKTEGLGGRERISIRKIELFNSIKFLAVVVRSKFLNSSGNHLKLPAGIIVH